MYFIVLIILIYIYKVYFNKKKKLKSENFCKDVFEQYFNKEFPKIYHKNIINPLTKRSLQLDGYCKELELAFEYNGKQHYEHVKFFHPSIEDFESQKQRDRIKIKRCKELNIHLIIIPYYIKNIKDYIIKEIREFQKLKK